MMHRLLSSAGARWLVAGTLKNLPKRVYTPKRSRLIPMDDGNAVHRSTRSGFTIQSLCRQITLIDHENKKRFKTS
jgi:hypothetical protein